MTLPMNPEDEAKIGALLISLWERNLPLLHERLAILDRAASEAASDHLSVALRAEALEIAHKLSGTLGMFGYQHGTEIAREIEVILKSSATDRLHQLTTLTAELRQTLLGK
jgi:HPt (histidine-containing phosphotransfer) domain-containing protein